MPIHCINDNNPTVFSLSLESTSLAEQRRLEIRSKVRLSNKPDSKIFCSFFTKSNWTVNRRLSLQPSPSAVAATSPEGRGFKVRLPNTHKITRLVILQCKSRKANLVLTLFLTQKFFAYFFSEKTRSVHPPHTSRKINLDLLFT